MCVWVGLDDIRRRRRSSCSLKMLLTLRYYDKRESGNIHQQCGRNFNVENVRSSNPSAFVW